MMANPGACIMGATYHLHGCHVPHCCIGNGCQVLRYCLRPSRLNVMLDWSVEGGG